MKSLKLSVIALLIGGIGFVSCSKENETGADSNGNPLFAGKVDCKTSQSIMVDFGNLSSGSYSAGEMNYKFNEETAYGYFGFSPAIAYNDGNGALKQALRYNECNFKDGNSLVSTSFKSGGVTYTVTPKSTNAVEAFTAWDLLSSTDGNGIAMEGAKIAGLSWAKIKEGNKYSFSLVDVNGVRITNLEVLVNGVSVGTIALTTDDIVTGEDFTYVTTQTFGCNAAIVTKNGSALGIINNDDFAGNNGDVVYAKIPSITLIGLVAGDNTITIKGSVKGNDGSASSSFTNSVVINTPRCD